MYYVRLFCLLSLILFTFNLKATEVCFSPGNSCDQKLIDFISTAKSSLDVAIYSLTHQDIADAIIAKAKNINIRVVVDRGESKGHSSKVQYLKDSGIAVRFGTQKGIMHNKYTIVDKKLLETGSFNYSDAATNSNHENQIYLDDQDVVNEYIDDFNTLWSKAKNN